MRRIALRAPTKALASCGCDCAVVTASHSRGRGTGTKMRRTSKPRRTSLHLTRAVRACACNATTLFAALRFHCRRALELRPGANKFMACISCSSFASEQTMAVCVAPCASDVIVERITLPPPAPPRRFCSSFCLWLCLCLLLCLRPALGFRLAELWSRRLSALSCHGSNESLRCALLQPPRPVPARTPLSSRALQQG